MACAGADCAGNDFLQPCDDDFDGKINRRRGVIAYRLIIDTYATIHVIFWFDYHACADWACTLCF